MDFPCGSMVKNLPSNVGGLDVQSLDQEDLLEKEITIHSRVLAWKISWTEESGRLQCKGWQGVRHSLATEYSCTTSIRFKDLNFRMS